MYNIADVPAKEDTLANLQRQIDTLVTYFQSHCTRPGTIRLGLEVQHFITKLDNSPVDYEQLQHVLHTMQRAEDDPLLADGLYLGYRNSLYTVCLGPGGQLAIRMAPRNSVRELMLIYESCYARLCTSLASAGMRAHTLGVHPSRRAELLPIIPQSRWLTLDRYFKNTGGHGGLMLRATAATHVSIDYSSESDFIRKYRVASLIVPLLALLTDNSPFYHGSTNHGYSVRTHVWNDVDPDRCGIYPDVMDSGFGFSDYANKILQKPLVVARHGSRIVGVGRKSAFEVYPSVMGKGDVEQVLSMFCFDVSLQDGIVLRVADSMPPRFVAAYAQLIKTIFSSPAAQDGILRRYAGADAAQIEAAKLGVCCNGYQAQVYGRAAAGEISWLMAQAKSHAAAPEERRLLEPLASLAARRKTIREIEHYN